MDLGELDQLDKLYQDLLGKYKSAAKREDYEKDAQKVADVFTKNPRMHLARSSPSLGKYVPYPDYDDKNFNLKLYKKKEFIRNFQDTNTEVEGATNDFEAISKSKCSQTSFRLTPNQKFIKNFMSPLTPYNGILLFHSVGVGKTCTAISIAEQYHQLYQKPVLVILSHTLIDNFKKQLFDITKYDITTNRSNLCTGTKYPDLILDKHFIKPDVLEKNINKLINKWYKFIGYKKLVSIFNQTMEKVKKQEKDSSKHEKMFYDKIKEYFSDRLIIIDEAHNLRNSSEKGTKQTAQTFWNLLKHTENVKMVLLTATPMFNSVTEITWLLNLLLTNDKRPNIKMHDIFDKTGTLSPQGKKKLIETARGYVSYMRGENPFTFPFRLFPSINNDKNLITNFPSHDFNNKKISDDEKIKFLEIIGSRMSTYQKAVYNIFKKRIVLTEDDDVDVDDEVEVDGEEETVSNDLRSIVQISNIVYPIEDLKDQTEIKKTYGRTGFDNTFINSAKKGLKYRYSNNCMNKYGEILSYPLIHMYAPKIKTIIDYILNSEGIIFVYSNYYPSGILPLAIALEHVGFAKYNTGNITGENISVDNKLSGKKRPSYVVISRNSDLSPNNDKEIDMVKSKENADGSIIKVVIASQIASEGIDFKRMREVHILEPWYNLNRSEQIVGRAVRTCSHIDMPKEKRNVTVFFHGNVYDDREESVDLRTYRIAERKQKKITEVEKLLKESSIDCNLNRSSLTYNVKDLNMNIPLTTSQGTSIQKYAVGDRDFSYVCNYAKCELKCNLDIQKHNVSDIDESTYDTRFILDDVSLYQRYIAKLYEGTRKAFTYEKIADMLSKEYKIIDDEVLQYALQEMLDEKTHVYDSDETRGYLIYRSNKYIFQSSLSNDKRMTVEQRELPLEVKNRVRLNVSVLKRKVDKTNAALKSNVLQASSKDNLLHYIEDTYNEIMSVYSTNNVNINQYDKYIVDSIIDRLNYGDFVKFIEELAKLHNVKRLNNNLHKNCLRSLIEAGILLMDKEEIKHFYNHYDGEMYCLRSNKEFKKCSPLELNKISSFVNDIKSRMTNQLEDGVRGHIEVSGNQGMCDFKVRDNPKSSGYVCWKTSSLSLGDIRDRIKTYDKKIELGNLIKKDMCFLYELILRSQGKKVFKRSIVKKLI
jgi:hypothetical protein